MIRLLSRRFSTIKLHIKQGNYDPILVSVSTDEKLGPQLKKSGVPLEFECGFSCECGTCAVQFEDKALYDQLNDSQPILPDEEYVHHTERLPRQTRLSCQIKAMAFMNNTTLRI